MGAVRNALAFNTLDLTIPIGRNVYINSNLYNNYEKNYCPVEKKS